MDALTELAASWAAQLEDIDAGPRLWVGRSGDGLCVEFFGNPMDDAFPEFCDRLIAPGVAEQLAWVAMRGPDEGANGTVHWDLSPLAAEGLHYPRLRALFIEQGQPGDHNTHILGADYDEDGVLGRILAAAPTLRELAAPSAPAASFFDTPPRPLQSLSILAGYHHQSFLENLARSGNLPDLRHLAYGERIGPGMEDCPRAGFSAYLEVARSALPLRSLVLTNPALSDEQLRELKQARPDGMIQVIRSEAVYLR